MLFYLVRPVLHRYLGVFQVHQIVLLHSPEFQTDLFGLEWIVVRGHSSVIRPKMLQLCGKDAAGTITFMADEKPWKSMPFRVIGRMGLISGGGPAPDKREANEVSLGDESGDQEGSKW